MQVKFDLSDWQGRRARLLPILLEAEKEGLVVAGSTERLGEFLLGRGVGVAGAASPVTGTAASGLDTPRESEPASPVEESEAPRFVRGFHDILITIGIIVGLVGLGGLASVYAVIPAAIMLAEVLVRRQRLALPAVVLTIAIVGSAAFGTISNDDGAPVWMLFVSAATAIVIYARYKVPIALASGLVFLFAGLVMIVALALHELQGGRFFDAHPSAVVALIGVFAVLTFGTALHFDIGDRHRLTRRSDVAFWMHLAAAPAILYTIMAHIYLGSQDGWFSSTTTIWQAAATVLAVVLLMLIGIVLDRRAFVTSGLLSFGYAFKVLLTEGGFERLTASTGTLASFTLLVIGVVVLSLGIGWQPLRRIVVGRLPDGLRDLVPPVRG